MKKLTPSIYFLSLKRKNRQITKKYKEEQKEKQKEKRKQADFESTGHGRKYHSIILDSLNTGFGCSRPNRKHYFHLDVPEVFSIIDNPQESLEKIRDLVQVARSDTKISEMKINHSGVKSNDLAAETILGYCACEFDKEKKYKFDIKGIYPNNPYLTRYLKAIGIIKYLDIKHEYLVKNEESKLKIFRTKNGMHTQQDDVGHSDLKENTAAKFAHHINECLALNNRQLTDEGKSLLTIYIGEIIGNAEEHPSINRWAVYGYLDNSEDGENICEIAIFNFGGSIADSFQSIDRNKFAYQQIAPYIEKHQTNGFFNESWTEEALLTLVALQGDISSKNTDSTTDRGQGTIETINFFQKISEECNDNGKCSAKMAILSGSTHILFDGTYSLREDSSGRKVIAFNKENSLEIKPDSKYIKTLKNINFPGTIISIRFPLEKTGTFIQ